MAKKNSKSEETFVCRYKYRLYPTAEQIKWFHQQFSGMRFMYNRILDFADKNYEETGKNCIEKFSFATYKKEHPNDLWLKELLASAVNQEHRFAIRAFTNYFRRLQNKKKNKSNDVVNKPKRKSVKKDRNSFSIQTQHCSDSATKGSVVLDWENNTVKFPKIGIISAVLHRRFVGGFETATIMEDCGEYYISLVIRPEHPQPLPKTGKSVGIDMGKRENLVIPSEGEPYPNPKPGNKSKRKLRRLNKKLARQQRVLVPDDQLTEYQKSSGKPVYIDSIRRAKTKCQIQKLYAHDKHIRQNYAHNISIDLVRKYDLIGVENLNIKGQVSNGKKKQKSVGEQKLKPRKGSAKARKANHRTTMDAGWYRIKEDIRYKAEWYGKQFEEVGRFFASSQMCHKCGHLNKKVKDPKVIKYVCDNCGEELDRDVNAAINIREEAIRLRREKKVKQEAVKC